jgi:phosphatidylglycerophosphate synthase
MKKQSNQFANRLTVLTAITFLVSSGLTYLLPEKLVSPSWPFIIVFFFAISIFVFRFLQKKSGGNQGKFINAFMLSTTVKLLLYLSIILIYVLINRADAIGFILNFFAYYMIFTVFEILSILSYLRKPQSNLD